MPCLLLHTGMQKALCKMCSPRLQSIPASKQTNMKDLKVCDDGMLIEWYISVPFQDCLEKGTSFINLAQQNSFFFTGNPDRAWPLKCLKNYRKWVMYRKIGHSTKYICFFTSHFIFIHGENDVILTFLDTSLLWTDDKDFRFWQWSLWLCTVLECNAIESSRSSLVVLRNTLLPSS